MNVLVGVKVIVGVGLANNSPTLPNQPLTAVAIFLPIPETSLGKMNPNPISNATTRAIQIHLFCNNFRCVGL